MTEDERKQIEEFFVGDLKEEWYDIKDLPTSRYDLTLKVCVYARPPEEIDRYVLENIFNTCHEWEILDSKVEIVDPPDALLAYIEAEGIVEKERKIKELKKKIKKLEESIRV